MTSIAVSFREHSRMYSFYTHAQYQCICLRSVVLAGILIIQVSDYKDDFERVKDIKMNNVIITPSPYLYNYCEVYIDAESRTDDAGKDMKSSVGR
jgi:hypothetical protein